MTEDCLCVCCSVICRRTKRGRRARYLTVSLHHSATRCISAIIADSQSFLVLFSSPCILRARLLSWETPLLLLAEAEADAPPEAEQGRNGGTGQEAGLVQDALAPHFRYVRMYRVPFAYDQCQSCMVSQHSMQLARTPKSCMTEVCLVRLRQRTSRRSIWGSGLRDCRHSGRTSATFWRPCLCSR